MNAQSDLIVALTPVIDGFKSMSIPYLIGGSVASSALGVPRTTLDVDLVAEIKREHASHLFNSLRDDYYVDENMILDAIRTRSSFNLIHLKTMLKIDVFLVKRRPYDAIAFARKTEARILEEASTKSFFLSSPEDVVINKLEWYRLGGEISERQWNDAIGVLKVQENRLDLDYMRRWADSLNVIDLLEKALVEADDADKNNETT